MNERVQDIEHKMDQCTTTVNDLIEACKDQSDDTEWIKAKLADLEERSRRNNIKLKGYLNLSPQMICRNMQVT